jgi:hypothetical protein
MDLLACTECERRFYLPGVAAAGDRRCPECGGDLALSEQGIAAIPIDAHWLDPRDLLAPEATVVELRCKRKHVDGNGQRIVRSLGAYFHVEGNGQSVRVSVNRGEAADAALRVAAVLDGVDGTWEEHFYLPTSGFEVPPPQRPHRAGRLRHLHLARSRTTPGAWGQSA